MADVASLLGTSPGSLAHQLYVRTPSYQCFYIPKKAGGSREINAPQEPIATYQRIIASIISAIYRPHRAVHGFCPDRSVVTNARRHVARRLVLNFDIRDFFPSIPFGRVRWALMRPPLGLNSRVATIVAQICCFQGRLAQGAPSSPVLSNLVCRRLDHQLSRLAVLAGCSYTRYADDLTLSTRDASFPAAIVANSGTTPPTLSAEIAEILRQSGFHINPEKTRIQGPATRKVVTGLIVNARPNVPRAYVRELRAALHSWRRHGESAADARFATVYASKSKRTPPAPLREYLRGRLAFLSMVRGAEDRVTARYTVEFAELARTHGPVIVGRHATEEFLLTRALWIVVGEDIEGNEDNATAFALDQFGIVSCAHIFQGEDIVRWYAVPAWDQSKRYPIRAWRFHRHYDLAQFQAPIPTPASLIRGDSRKLQVGQELIVAGFPAWPGPVDRPRIQAARSSKVHVRSLVRYTLLTGAHLRGGDSGGPVLDTSGRVVAIVHKDMAAPDLPNGCVLAQHLDELQQASGPKHVRLTLRGV